MGNKFNSALPALLTAALIFSSANAAEKEPVDYINPIIGASTSADAAGILHGLGKTFPGACTPFGLVQLSPDTITGGDNGSGYSWQHNTIEGFSFIHMSGIGWYGDFGNFLVMPTNGELKTACGRSDAPEKGYRSRFSHDREEAQAGYYRVMLDDYKITAELTAAPHSGILRFTYPEDGVRRVQIDLARRIGGTSSLQSVKVSGNTISGRMVCPPECGGWGNGDGKSNYTVYYHCQFSVRPEKFGVWSAEIPEGAARKREDVTSEARQKIFAEANIMEGCEQFEGKHIGFFAEFPASEKQVLVKCGISFVSEEGAKKNLEAEIADWDFDAVRKNATKLWNEAVSKVNVSGGTDEQKEILYTALYHTMIDPRAASDVDGMYPGADGKNHHATGSYVYRTIFSGWDVFRSQFPLQTIINPQLVNDEINSLLQMSILSGKRYLPRWEIMNSYSGCMLGNPAVSVIADAYQKGIRNYDEKLAYETCRRSVEEFSNQPLGYVPDDISRTLEYAYSDWCVGRLAELMGRPDDEKKYKSRALAWSNIYDEQVGWFRSKRADGKWNDWQGKTVHGQGCTESNPFQQGWFVPQDVYGMIELLGRDKFLAELNEMFDKAPDKFTWNDYYNHPNEPVHHVPFLFVYAGEGWLTQKWSRTICENAYGTGWDGLCGNEDVGQMSAWYVLAAAGIHPVCPGDGIYIITSPLFNEIDFTLDEQYAGSNRFKIIARGNSPENKYIQSLRLNGKPLDRLWIRHSEITAGGRLEMVMGNEPNKQLGKDNLPPANY
ncbi:MAG: GH92 family glycosyl hydrolase [Phycisphaerae bacterium]